MSVQPDTRYKDRPAGQAILGYNVPNDVAKMQVAIDGGAELLRSGFGWDGIEDYATGALALQERERVAIALAAERGVRLMPVFGFGPVHRRIGQLTVAEPSIAGATAVRVTGTMPTVDYPSCFLSGKGGAQLTSHSSGAGTLITSVSDNEDGTHTIHLAVPLDGELLAKATVNVDRYRTPPISGQSPGQAGVAGAVRAIQYVAQQLAACGGYVSLWNEWPGIDHWADLSMLYAKELLPEGVERNDYNMAVRSALLGRPGFPANVGIVNDSSDFGPFGGTVKDFPGVPAALLAMILDSAHPYDDRNPTSRAWDDEGSIVNTLLDAPPGFAGLARKDATEGVSVIFSECGLLSANDERQAVYVLQKAVCSWLMGVTPVIYACDPDVHGMSVVRRDTAGQIEPRPAYTALQRLVELKRSLGTGAGLPAPRFGRPQQQAWPLMAGGIVGSEGSMGVGFQRTYSTEHHGWERIPAPAAVQVPVELPTGHKEAEAVNVRTGATVPFTATAAQLLVPVTDDPVAVIAR